MHHGRERSAHSGGAHSSMIPLPLRVCSHPLSSLGPQFQQIILSHGKRPCHLQLMGSSWRMRPTSELLGPGSTRRIIHKFGRIWIGCQICWGHVETGYAQSRHMGPSTSRSHFTHCCFRGTVRKFSTPVLPDSFYRVKLYALPDFQDSHRAAVGCVSYEVCSLHPAAPSLHPSCRAGGCTITSQNIITSQEKLLVCQFRHDHRLDIVCHTQSIRGTMSRRGNTASD